jgi:DNA mismatch repair ATPase MutL
VRNEIETKRNEINENETKSTKTKRNETKRNQRNKTKPTKAKRNQRKQNEIENGRKNNRGLKEIKPIFTITMLDYFPHMSVFHQERTGFVTIEQEYYMHLFSESMSF